VKSLKAKDFATEITSHNVIEKDLKGTNPISAEHVENNKAVRKMPVQRGVQPGHSLRRKTSIQ
jgi:DNA-damage-inducible protein D